MQRKNIITVLALLLYGVFLLIAWDDGLAKYYGLDILVFALLVLFFNATFDFWRLTIPVYTMIVLSLAAHLMGIFGWYNVSPLFIPWDHVTHAVPLFTFTIFLYNFSHQWMERFWSKKTWALMVLILLGGLGIGALIENVEFAGFLALGYGEGGLFFGGPGDGTAVTSAQADAIQEFGGGYLNTELDLVWNAIGALAAIVLMSLRHFMFKKRVLSETG